MTYLREKKRMMRHMGIWLIDCVLDVLYDNKSSKEKKGRLNGIWKEH